MADNFPFQDLSSLGVPALSGAAVTLHDTNEITVTRALWVGTGGTVVLVLKNDTSAITLTNVADGALLPVRAKIVKSTGTTASNIVALY